MVTKRVLCWLTRGEQMLRFKKEQLETLGTQLQSEVREADDATRPQKILELDKNTKEVAKVELELELTGELGDATRAKKELELAEVKWELSRLDGSSPEDQAVFRQAYTALLLARQERELQGGAVSAVGALGAMTAQPAVGEAGK